MARSDHCFSHHSAKQRAQGQALCSPAAARLPWKPPLITPLGCSHPYVKKLLVSSVALGHKGASASAGLEGETVGCQGACMRWGSSPAGGGQGVLLGVRGAFEDHELELTCIPVAAGLGPGFCWPQAAQPGHRPRVKASLVPAWSRAGSQPEPPPSGDLCLR